MQPGLGVAVLLDLRTDLILVGPKPERGISIIGIGCVMFRYVIIIFLSLVLVYAFAAV